MSKNIPNHERSRKTHTHETASSVLRAAHGHRESAVPLGEVKSGHLQIGRGISKATLSAQPSLEELYRARFEGPVPEIRAKEGIVTLLYPFPSLTTFAKNMLGTLQHAADIVLNGSIPWQITIHGGAWQVKADLRQLQLRAFEVQGGANDVEMTLPQPLGTVTIRITEGANHVRLHRPIGVAASVYVARGASGLTLDSEHLDAYGDDVHLETPDYWGVVNRYQIEVLTGASQLVIDTL